MSNTYELHIHVEKGEVYISGTISDLSSWDKVLIIAANPIDRMTTYAGSGLPFPCQDVAFDQTPNIVTVTEPNVSIVFAYPNSYYTYDNWTKVPPSIFLVKTHHQKMPSIERYTLPDPLVLRTLNYRKGYYAGPSFYSQKETIIPMGTAESYIYNMTRAKAVHDIA